MDRRSFLLLTAASVVTRPTEFLGTIVADDNGNSTPWYASMRRCGQIDYNKRDPLTMDSNAWGNYWASLKVDAVLLNGGGIVAFYPTQVPYHHRSQFLGTRDLFGEIVAAMKQRGMRAVARMDCNLAYEEALKAHPEWFGMLHALPFFATRKAIFVGRIDGVLQDLGTLTKICAS